jgi:alpha-acetolactate decarboxylase
MKIAEEWQKELAGETSLESIREIQHDAMMEAARIVKHERETKMKVNTRSIEAAITAAANKLLERNPK